MKFTFNHVSTVKKHLLKLRGHACEVCKNTLWNGLSIPIELHHVNGDRKNNELSNLQLLCPNCHAQTPNFTSKNAKKTRRIIPDDIILKTIPLCQSVTEVLKTLGLSYYGQGHTRIKNLIASRGVQLAVRQLSELEMETRLAKRKVTRPSPEELKALVWSKPASQVAKDLGVCDSAIVKWCRFYGISKPQRGYWRKLVAHDGNAPSPNG